MSDDLAEWTRAARALLRRARAGSLATVSEGQPYASLVTPAMTIDGALLMLLSGLSPHTRHLRAEPRCSLLVTGQPTGPNPQTAPRLTVLGTAAPAPDPALKARWLALHPYAAFYAELGDFQLWQLLPSAGQYVGGFARAHRMNADALRPGVSAAAALAEAEAGIIAHCNADHPDAMELIAHWAGEAGAGWRMVACDPDGCDLARDETVLRIDWSTEAADARAVRTELVRLAHAARNPVAPASRPDV